MRGGWLVLVAVFAVTCNAAAQSAMERLKEVPDLTPLLSEEQAEEALRKWLTSILEKEPGLSEETKQSLAAAQRVLSERIPGDSRLMLYSLNPVSDADIERYPTQLSRAPGSEELERFHGYPVLGTIEVSDPKQAIRWVEFLKTKIIPGGFFLCDFRPRHGFRFSTSEGYTDLLMCFQCSQLRIIGIPKNDVFKKLNPIFSTAVRDVVNALFDTKGVLRDRPEEEKRE